MARDKDDGKRHGLAAVLGECGEAVRRILVESQEFEEQMKDSMEVLRERVFLAQEAYVGLEDYVCGKLTSEGLLGAGEESRDGGDGGKDGGSGSPAESGRADPSIESPGWIPDVADTSCSA